MNRKEFEAVLAMEGMRLRLSNGRCKKAYLGCRDRRPWCAAIYKGREDGLMWYTWSRNRKTAMQKAVRAFIAGKVQL
jgi:hypothetical protein